MSDTPVDSDAHDAVTRWSFGQQIGLFAGPDAVFARRLPSALSWLGQLDDTMIVLDVACGAGHVAELAARQVRQAVGVDVTPAVLSLGADRVRQAGLTNVLLQQGRASDLPFVDGSFDLVFCRGALHHFPEPAAAVAEMVRVCRPGGRVSVSDMTVPAGVERQAFDRLHRLVDPSHVGVLTEKELTELVEAAVGPLAHRPSSSPVTLAIDDMLTQASDREAVLAVVRAELSGDAVTGFCPALDSDGNGPITVTFVSTQVSAVRPIDG
jgi:SAM-dependent methyltransferase